MREQTGRPFETRSSYLAALLREPVCGNSYLAALLREPVGGNSYLAALLREPVGALSDLAALLREPVTRRSSYLAAFPRARLPSSYLAALLRDSVLRSVPAILRRGVSQGVRANAGTDLRIPRLPEEPVGEADRRLEALPSGVGWRGACQRLEAPP